LPATRCCARGGKRGVERQIYHLEARFRRDGYSRWEREQINDRANRLIYRLRAERRDDRYRDRWDDDRRDDRWDD
jgi:hypothetical protein